MLAKNSNSNFRIGILLCILLQVTFSALGKTHGYNSVKHSLKKGSLCMPSVFSDSMILQRNKPLVFWGTAKQKSVVHLLFNGTKAEVISDSVGEWKIQLPAMKEGGPYVLSVSDEENNSLVFKEILLGDVWLCSGQSNMNFMLAAEKNGAKEIAAVNNHLIREFRCKMPDGINNPENIEHSRWIPAEGEKTKYFSAVAYYFAKKIQQSENIPVGIIVMSCGDTRVESWMSEEVIHANPLLHELSEFQSAKENEKKIAQHHRPGLFYNSIVYPLKDFTVKGVIWYQGESTTLPDRSGRLVLQRAVEYKPLFAGLINCWRKDRNDPDLPFYFVQLPNFRFVTKKGVENLYWSVIRQAQLEVYKEVPNTGMVVTIDAGDSTNIHPTDKEIIGNRLADWALANNYGKKELIVSGPVPKSLKRSGAQLVVKFDFAGKKLIGRNGKSLAGFTISDQSSPEVFVTADAFIKKDKVIISNSNIKKTAVVRYGWDDNPDASLFNEAGLPATPFVIKIDDKTKISM